MKRRLLGIFGAAAIGGALVLGGAAPAGAKGVIVVRPGQSIQAAVDAAGPGTTIVVKRGTYAENVVIRTDGIKLLGHGATIVPPDDPQPNACSFDEPAVDGICAAGDVEFPEEGPPIVSDPLRNVTISGFTVAGFEGSGIIFFGAQRPVITHNRTLDNEEYGIARFVSTGGRIVGNRASGSEEAGIYVGDSPDANVLIAGNRVFDNELFGFFLRDAAHGRLVGNRSTGNCVGAIVLNTGANVAGDWRFSGNNISDNDAFCLGDEEEGTPPLSGIGVAIAGGSDNTLIGNRIVDNTPSGDVLFAGGVVVLDASEPGQAVNPPSGNVVRGNVILDNEPDLFWDGSGEGNVFRNNRCESSVPDGLC